MKRGALDIKRKILLISCKGLGKGGVQAVLMSIIRKLNHTFTFDLVLLTDVKGFYEEEFLSYGGSIYRIPVYDKKNFIFRKLSIFLMPFMLFHGTKKIIQEHGPYCAIHCNNYYESAYCLKAAYKSNIQIRICHIHACTEKANKIVNTIRKINLKQINKYATNKIACSKEAFASVFGENETADVYVNSYNAEKFDSQKYNVDNSKQELILTQIGSFSPNKNQLFSIRVLSHLKKYVPDAKLNLVGFDMQGYQALLEKEIEILDLKDSVVILPSDTDIPKLLSSTTLSLIPSKKEGFCIVAEESQAMGVPVFASDALPDASNAGGCNYLPLNLGPKECANQILTWYENNKCRKFEFNTTKFEENNVIQKYKELYEGKK